MEAMNKDSPYLYKDTLIKEKQQLPVIKTIMSFFPAFVIWGK